MLNANLNTRSEVMGKTQAMRFGALAFFLLSTAIPQSSSAATNYVDGTAFDTNHVALATTNSIASIANGTGLVEIGYAGTTNLSLTHQIDGYVIVSNNFDTFTINATGGKISGSQYAVLSVTGGTNLTITGGQFIGVTGNAGANSASPLFPPIYTNYNSIAAMGGVISNTETVVISKTAFSGATYAPITPVSLGTDGLQVYDTSLTITDDGSNSSTLTGGNGGAVNVQGSDVLISGGTALYAENSSLTIGNGTFKGGNAGSATAYSSYTAATYGGHAIYATNATIQILKGTFTGGNAGAATSGSGSTLSLGGVALFTEDSTVQISGGQFTGGTSGTANVSFGGAGMYANNSSISIGGTAKFTGGNNAAAMYAFNSDVAITGGTFTGGAGSDAAIGGEALYVEGSSANITAGTFTGGDNAAALYAFNSDLTIDGGTYQGGAFGTNSYFGLLSVAETAQTNDIALNGGTINSIDFAGGGIQYLTAGPGLTLSGLMVLDGSTVIADNQSNSPFQDVFIRSGHMQLQNDFTLGNGGSLSFLVVTNSYGTLSAPTATFETNSSIDVDVSMASFNYGTNDVSLVSASGGIYVIDAGSITNIATSTNLAENINLTATTIGRTSLSDVFVDGGSNLVFRFTTQHLKDYWTATGQFGDFSDELETLINPEMNTTIDMIDDPALSSAAVEQTYFTTFNTFQTALQGMRTAVGQPLSRGTEFREALKLIPVGARGPYSRYYGYKGRNQLRGWGKYYGNYFTHSESGLNPSYKTGLNGGVLGIDTSFGQLIVGLSGGASHYDTKYSSDTRENTVAYHGSLYSTYAFEKGYIDANVTYGMNQVETHTSEPFRLNGDYDAQIGSAYIGGGYDMIDTRGGTVFTPEASFQYSKYMQDAYTETSTEAVPRSFDQFDADSMLGSIGMNISMQKRRATQNFAFMLDGRLHWMHEFNPDPDALKFSLEGGSNQYLLSYPSLDEDIYRLGIGSSFVNIGRGKPKNVLLRIDFDELFGDGFNSHNLSAKLIYAF